jgi:thiol-disulfide isomerase/thioredoxin
VNANKVQRLEERARAKARRMALLITAGVVVLTLVGAAILFVRAQNASATTDPSTAAAASSALVASSSTSTGAGNTAGAADVTDLDKAADAVGFHVTTGPNVGVIENLPAETTLPAPSESLLAVGSTGPDFTLSTPDGKSVRLSDLRGRTVFLEFFATWCPHCQAEAPHLLAIYKGLDTAKVAFVSVNADSEDAASVHAFTRHFGLPWTAVLDPGSPPGSFNRQGGVGPVSSAYGLALFPTFYIIDAAGRVAWRADREQPDSVILSRLHDVSGS